MISSNRKSKFENRKFFILVLLLLASTLHAETRLLLDRPTDPIGMNLGWEFPGAGATCEAIKDPDRGDCRKVEYDFTQGGQYICADFPGPPAASRSVRFWYKNPQSGKAVFRIKDDTEQHFIAVFDFKPGPWQEITIPLEKSRFYAHFGGANDGKIHLPLRSVSIGIEKTAPIKGAFFLSDLSVDLPGSSSLPELRVCIQPKPFGGVVFLNEITEYHFIFDNRLSIPRKAKISYRVVNEEGKVYDEKKIEVDIAPFQIKTTPFPLTASQYGYQHITARVFVPGQKPVNLESGLAVVRKPQRYLQKDRDSFFSMIQDKGLYETNARLGVKNIMVSYNWQWLEVIPGMYGLDNELPKQLDKYNLGLMIKFNHFTPPWAQWTKAPRPELRGYIAPEHLASFEKWIQTTVAHYKGKIHSIELINEPDLGYWQGPNLDLATGVDLYCKTLQAGYKGAKAGDPNVVVWGLGVSGYDNETGMRFSKAVLARAAKDLDAVGNHPYADNRYIGKGKVAQTAEQAHVNEKCQRTLDILAQHKKPREMYIGELGWALHREEPALGEPSMTFAQTIPQAHILAKTVPGVKSLYWFCLDSCDEGGYFYGMLRGVPGPMYPLPAACAYAICADLLDHTDIVGPVMIGSGIRAWRFDRNDADDSIVAFWSAEEPINLTVNLPNKAQIINSFGKTVAGGSKAEIPVNGLPLYAVTTKAQAAALVGALERARMSGVGDFKIIRARITGDTELQMTVVNYTEWPIEAKFTFQKRTKTIVVKPGRQTLTLGIPRIVADPKAGSADLSAVWKTGQDRVTLRTDLVPVANLTGPASAEEKIRKLTAESRPLVRTDRLSVLPPDPTIPWSGPQDLSLRTWIGWDEKDLLLAVEVTDNIHASIDTGEGFWAYDSIQLALDSAGDSTTAFDDNDTEFGFAKGKKENIACLTFPRFEPLKCDTLKIERDETRKVTLYTAAVPWHSLAGFKPKPGRVFAFNIIANDNDGQTRKCWIGLTPGIGEEKRPGQYLRFLLTR